MVNRITELTNAFETTLAAELSAVATSMTLDDASGLTVPFYLVLEPDNSSQREYVYVTGLAGAIATIDSRYLAGSAAGSGLTHPASSVVRMSVMSQHIEDLNDRADDLQSQITGIGDHGGLTGLGDDDHTQYLNSARHNDSEHSGISHDVLGNVSANDHHNQDHSTRHEEGQADELNHNTLAGVTADAHHAQNHTARHSVGGADELAGIANGGYFPGTRVQFTSGGSFTKASYPGLRAVIVEVQAGGGAGGGAEPTGAAEASLGGGGAAGGWSRKFILASALATSETVTVGAGGTGVSGTDGNPGGNSSFGAHCTATGGPGGLTIPAGGSLRTRGGTTGPDAGAGDLALPGAGGHGGVRLNETQILSGHGADGILGRGGKGSGATAIGEAGAGYGAGGAGSGNQTSQSGRVGGAGAPGIVIVQLLF